MGFTVKFRFHPIRTQNCNLNPHAQQLKFIGNYFGFVFLVFFFFSSEETENHLENIPPFDPIHINFRPTLTALRVEFQPSLCYQNKYKVLFTSSQMICR